MPSKSQIFRFDSNNQQLNVVKRLACRLSSLLLPKLSVIADFDIRSANSPVIFLIDSTSLLDYTAITRYANKAGLSTPVYVESFPPRITQLSTSKRSDDQHSLLVQYLEEGNNLILPMQTPADLFSPVTLKQHDTHERELLHLLKWLQEQSQSKTKDSVCIVPTVCLWSREPKHIVPTFADRIFGDNIAPGFLRRLCQILYNFQLSRLVIGKPVELGELIKADEGVKDTIRIQRLKRHLARSLTNLHRIATGPTQKWKRKIIELVVRDKGLTKTLTVLAKREASSVEELQEKTRRILYELAAEYSVPHTGFLHWCFLRVYNRCFEKLCIDTEGFNNVRKAAAKGHPLVLVPTHKSHMDYFLVSDVFYGKGLNPPHIAAGINLAFWPIGYFFRRGGAYFIRRQIRGDLLYARVLDAYIRRLLREGYNQEFFIEGGRSRDGKMKEPRMGILGMTVNAFFEKAVSDLNYVPIGIVYDKIIEDESYVNEIRGGTKKRESFFQALKVIKMLRRKYGRVYIQFGKPISLRDFISSLRKEKQSIDKRNVTKILATKISQSINQNVVITANSLVAMTLLAHYRIALSNKEVLQKVKILLSFIKVRGRPCPLGLDINETEIQRSLAMFLRFGLVNKIILDNETLYIAKEEKRLTLCIYKNMTLHHFLHEALFATAIGTTDVTTTRKEILYRLWLLRFLLKHEFIDLLDENKDTEEILSSGVNWFATYGYVIETAKTIKLENWKACELANILRSLITPFLESALATCSLLTKLPESGAEVEVPDAKELLTQWQQLFFRGTLQYRESGNTLSMQRSYQNLWELLSGNGQNRPRQFTTAPELYSALEQLIHYNEPPLAGRRRGAKKRQKPRPEAH